MTTLPMNPWMHMHLTSGKKIHIITPIPFQVGEEFQFERTFFGDIEPVYIRKRVTEIQRAFFAIDQEENFIAMIDKKVLTKQELALLASNNGNTGYDSFIINIYPKMENHRFYKKALEVKIVHWTDFKYE